MDLMSAPQEPQAVIRIEEYEENDVFEDMARDPSTSIKNNNTGQAAAQELWDLIHTSPNKVPRFANCQQGRTLIHPLLQQPSPQQEALGKRLSQALLAASPDGTLLNEEMESPTSTLQFPSPEENNEKLFSLSNLKFEQEEEEEAIHRQDKETDNVVSSSNTSSSSSTCCEIQTHSSRHSFVVCADTQLGMTSLNREWETELEYSRKAVNLINHIEPRPSFCCVCGDLVDMEETFYNDLPTNTSREIQDEQNQDFKKVWQNVHPDIALVCLCGNHDVGNRPTRTSIQRFTKEFGNDYLAFWVNGTFNIVLNSNLFGDFSKAQDLYQEQLEWLQERLEYATAKQASQIFCFGHHPWFLYHEEEEPQDLMGTSPYPQEWNRQNEDGFYDYYFHIPKQTRMQVMALFKQHGVTACFSGHFHQNLLSKSSWGMDMIVTAPLSAVFESSGKPIGEEKSARGVRVVTVDTTTNSFVHRFETI